MVRAERRRAGRLRVAGGGGVRVSTAVCASAWAAGWERGAACSGGERERARGRGEGEGRRVGRRSGAGQSGPGAGRSGVVGPRGRGGRKGRKKGGKEKGRKKWKRGKRKGKKGERERGRRRKRERDSRRHRRSVGHARRLGARERDARVEGETGCWVRVSGQVFRGSEDRNRDVPGKLGLGF